MLKIFIMSAELFLAYTGFTIIEISGVNARLAGRNPLVLLLVLMFPLCLLIS